MKVFQFPNTICFADKLGTEDFDDLLPISGWCEGDPITGIKAIYFAAPSDERSDKIIFRIPIEDLKIVYCCAGQSQFNYCGNDMELMETLKMNAERRDFRGEALSTNFDER